TGRIGIGAEDHPSSGHLPLGGTDLPALTMRANTQGLAVAEHFRTQINRRPDQAMTEQPGVDAPTGGIQHAVGVTCRAGQRPGLCCVELMHFLAPLPMAHAALETLQLSG